VGWGQFGTPWERIQRANFVMSTLICCTTAGDGGTPGPPLGAGVHKPVSPPESACRCRPRLRPGSSATRPCCWGRGNAGRHASACSERRQAAGTSASQRSLTLHQPRWSTRAAPPDSPKRRRTPPRAASGRLRRRRRRTSAERVSLNRFYTDPRDIRATAIVTRMSSGQRTQPSERSFPLT
jgi:hypothetical protein